VSEHANNSCHHRACALCALLGIERWIKRQVSRLIDCDYYHVILTIPSELTVLWQYNRSVFSTLLFQASWQSLHELLGDEQYLGALPGAIASLHTWTQTLLPHIHAHFLVTAGGMTADGQWRDPKRNTILLPAAVLRAKFRGKFRAMLIKAIEQDKLRLPPELSAQKMLNLLNKLGRKKWCVRIQPRYQHGRGVLAYLGRYVRGGPISPKRIVAYQDDALVIRYKRNEIEPEAKHSTPTFALTAIEFIQRFVQHIPPTGLHTVRNYGLFHPAKADLLAQAREIKGAFAPLVNQDTPASANGAIVLPFAFCPVCGAPLVLIFVLTPKSLPRAPPK